MSLSGSEKSAQVFAPALGPITQAITDIVDESRCFLPRGASSWITVSPWTVASPCEREIHPVDRSCDPHIKQSPTLFLEGSDKITLVRARLYSGKYRDVGLKPFAGVDGHDRHPPGLNGRRIFH